MRGLLGRLSQDGSVSPVKRVGYRRLFYCPVCGALLEGFEEHRGRVRARCSLCGSLERHRLSIMVLEDQVSHGRHLGRVLHFAPERSLRQYLERRADRGYVTTDVGAAGVDVQCDIAQTPFEDDEFDLIYCSHVLEHVTHDRAAMRELHRITRPGGVTLVMVPIGSGPTDEAPEKGATPELRLKHFGQDDHVRRYGPDIVDRLDEAGFRTRVVSSDRPEYAIPLRKFGLRRNDHVFLAFKPDTERQA